MRTSGATRAGTKIGDVHYYLVIGLCIRMRDYYTPVVKTGKTRNGIRLGQSLHVKKDIPGVGGTNRIKVSYGTWQ